MVFYLHISQDEVQGKSAKNTPKLGWPPLRHLNYVLHDCRGIIVIALVCLFLQKQAQIFVLFGVIVPKLQNTTGLLE